MPRNRQNYRSRVTERMILEPEKRSLRNSQSSRKIEASNSHLRRCRSVDAPSRKGRKRKIRKLERRKLRVPRVPREVENILNILQHEKFAEMVAHYFKPVAKEQPEKTLQSKNSETKKIVISKETMS